MSSRAIHGQHDPERYMEEEEIRLLSITGTRTYFGQLDHWVYFMCPC